VFDITKAVAATMTCYCSNSDGQREKKATAFFMQKNRDNVPFKATANTLAFLNNSK
jgi:hypothetical protein